MDSLTPSVVNPLDVLNGTKCDGIELTKDLFTHHKMSIVDHNTERLHTYLRIRSVPNLDTDDRQQCYQVMDNNTLEVIPPKGSNASKYGSDSADRKRFKFSQIMDESVDQMAVYETCGLPVVKRFLGGQNGLLFAYGITSSGKSYTMQGSPVNPGIIPRALNTVFEVIGHKLDKELPLLKPNTFTECQALSESDRELEDGIRRCVFDETDRSYKSAMNSFRSQISVIESSDSTALWTDVLHSTFRSDGSNIRCSVWISFYEIYKDFIYDLLDISIDGEKKSKIALLKDRSANHYVKGLRQICVTSAEEAYKVLLFGQNNLHVSSTNLNKNSSRSHCAFTISLVTTFGNSCGPKRPPHLNHLSICDLAGAERSDKANSTGDRLREAGKINESLFSLSRCIASLRHNQKFEHDPSKRHLVNFTTKLTKVFQPYLSGSGSAAMISNMNPSPNLFDETFFALKFTGVAAQVVVSYEEQRNKFQDSLKRLTQVWMQSSQRWSNFADLKQKPSISIIQTIHEEDEDEADVSVAQMELRINEMTRLDLSRADPEELEVLRSQIDFLADKLKQSEIEKTEMEVIVRRQVANEFNEMVKESVDMSDDRDRAKKNLEVMMTNRLLKAEDMRKQEKLEFENKLSKLETENFELREENCRAKEEKERALIEAELVNRVLEDKEQLIQEKDEIIEVKEQLIKELESKIVPISEMKSFQDMSTSPIKWQFTDASTSVLNTELNDMNCSAVNTIELKDTNTSAMEWEEESNSNISNKSIGVGNSFVDRVDNQTSTHNLIQTVEQLTNYSFECNNNSICVETNVSISTEDKETETEFDVTIKEEQCLATHAQSSEAATSPITCSQHNSLKEECVSEQQNELLMKLNQYEKEMKEKDHMIEFNRRVAAERDQELKALKEENLKLNEKMNGGFYLGQLLNHPMKSSSTAASIASSVSSITTKSMKSEDLNSVSSVESIPEKPKKTAKYSSRKRKPNLNSSMDKRYLKSVDSNLDTSVEVKSSQSSVTSMDARNDEIGEIGYSNKKSNKTSNKDNKKAPKRKQTSGKSDAFESQKIN
ncbi:unnamed protein product [Medioppia subpectinata]|uniref:Kinesin motor domain-containing protein n=1 Tax=Medioppia subpectinata TaxID=1979941 RepID=A0A7R9KUC8_9ACAR|nr:unnamed protein product [Medioppia subpectinata]CAG2109631.1 unnamed protein product [Medioppia subpectinata]